uniref:DUF2796 domain-containing protein n=1 Tax=Candidatus Kentrum sp. FW TaxID=2126338 RepID=A0A450SNK2_9GAMM|nr:MAG: Protein of unknown function (DUF2796) [Candidatus Kentron sp. FW]
MHEKTVILALTASLGSGITGPTLAEPAHQHGIADLDIAFSGQQIAMELHSPANNILGFEHIPKTDAEKQQLTASLSRLKKANSLFALPDAAGCKLASVEIEHPFELPGGHEARHHDGAHKHDDHNDKRAGHDGDHHGNHHEAGHKHGHKHTAHGQETHADISVSYRYHCQRAGKVDSIEAQGLFEHFPGFEKLKARWIGDRGQSAATITPENTRIHMR